MSHNALSCQAIKYTVPSMTHSPAVAKIRVNLDLFPEPLPTPSPARCQAATLSRIAQADGLRTWVCGMPCGMSSRRCPPAPAVVLDGLGMLKSKQTRTGEARGEGQRGTNT